MKMHVLSGGRLRMKRSTYFPDADRSEMIDLPVSCMLMRHVQGNVLFDTGCHPQVAENPVARLGGLAKFMTPVMPPGEHVLSGLKSVGLGADDVDVVVCSHFHTDHCGCNEFFKKATIFVHALELEAAKAPDAVSNGYLAIDWDHPIPLNVIDKQTDIFGDGKITLIPLPGHTPGTVGALVKLDRSGEFLLTSDAVSIRANLDTDAVPRNTKNPELFLRSFAEVRKIESGGATVICSHDSAQWNQLRKGPDAYD
ncbi:MULTISPECIES: N-acyl homoserine lactonase family protein [unclassified Afipia]|uniref:N-acyl homoserine lactonase family protein n=1 Tax=unclassified Afipia TaxID=2642050 RepID=UPI000463D315|nr:MULTISPECIES: N-acyl homoserine lactonase family protein [unclassified Afipia]